MKSIVILSIFCFLSVVAGARLKRQVNPNFGFPNFAFPQPAFQFPQIQPGAPGTQTSFTSQTLNTRFGEDSQPVVTGQATQFTSAGNNFQQTNTYIRPDGSVTSNKQTGRVRRQAPEKTKENPIKEDERKDRPEKIPASQHVAPQTPQTPMTPEQNFQHQQQPTLEKQNFQPDHQQQQPNYQQQQPNYQPNHQQQPNYYPQQAYPQQQVPPNAFPFGIGFFGQPQLGFQNPFGFAPIGFPQPIQPIAPIPQGIPPQGQFIGASQTLDNRFGEGEGVVTGGSQFITSQNGNYQITSSVLKPDGQVVTSQQSGTVNNKKP